MQRCHMTLKAGLSMLARSFSMASEADDVFLHSAWRPARAPDVPQETGELSSVGVDDHEWVPAVVPGRVLTSYEKAGLKVDPFHSDTMQDLSQDYYNVDYW